MADLTRYVDPRLDDRDAGDILDAALALAATRLPGWTPREGNTEMVLLELLAQEAAETVFAVNRLPGVIVEVLGGLYGITRDEGAPATTTVTVTVSDLLGRSVPAGTRVALDLGPDAEALVFATDIDVDVAAGELTGDVAATAETIGSLANGIPAGRRLTLVDGISWIDDLTLAAPVAAGRDAETDDAYLGRVVARFARLTDTLVLLPHFELAAADETDVLRARAINAYDPAVGPPGTNLGHVTVAVAAAGGGGLAAPRRTEIEASLAARTLASLAVHVVNADVTAVDVTVDVRRHAGYTDATVIANVTAVLAAYLDADTWPWQPVVPHNELIARIDSAVGVDLVISVSVPPADLPLPGPAPLAALGVVTVNVTAP